VRSDLEFLALTATEEPGRWRLRVLERLTRLDGRLYGGTAIAVSVAVAEALTGHSPLWTTTQFVSTVEEGAELEVRAETLAGGRRTTQVRVSGIAADGEVIFASLGATGRLRPDGLSGTFERRPEVSPPEASVRWDSPISGLARIAGLDELVSVGFTRGFAAAVDMAEAEVVDHPDPGPGRFCLWVRRRDREPLTPATIAYLADVVPMGVARALGVIAGGTSLDNTIRFGPALPTEWVLLDVRPQLAVGGYGHGIAHVWTLDGDLVATASQTASMVVFDPSHLTELVQPDRDGPVERRDGGTPTG
jgi:acyl-CoA thioesterase